jgi:hypothetical protein
MSEEECVKTCMAKGMTEEEAKACYANCKKSDSHICMEGCKKGCKDDKECKEKCGESCKMNTSQIKHQNKEGQHHNH